MLSNEWESLYQTCLENPADDAPRLVLADWFRDHGDDELADLIACQINDSLRLGYKPAGITYLYTTEFGWYENSYLCTFSHGAFPPHEGIDGVFRHEFDMSPYRPRTKKESPCPT